MKKGDALFIMKTQTKKRNITSLLTIIILIIMVIICTKVIQSMNSPNENAQDITYSSENYSEKEAKELVKEYAQKNNYSLDDYPEKLISLLAKNGETKDFVLSYPEEKDQDHKVNFKKYKNCDEVPLLMQWDKRWGYMDYGKDIAAFTACGPLCLSMTAIYVKQDTKYSPDYIIEWAKDNGYCLNSGGSSWTLISEGGEKLGLDVTEIPLDENRIIKNLKVGNPIICVMGPGDFTTTGHFIVMTGYENDKIKINDPNSYKNSQKLWKYEDIYKQIKNLWVIR